MSDVSSAVAVPQRLLLLRHGEVNSHRGDVPVTSDGLVLSRQVGERLATTTGPIRVLNGATRRTRETAAAIVQGARAVRADVAEPRVSFALRNPDIYVAGERVDMVSSAAALAEQIDGLGEEDAARVPFFRGFLTAKDRIGWWLRAPDTPGDDASTVARRIRSFAASLGDLPRGGLTVAVTHSPVLRACLVELLGEDPGEPAWLAGLACEIDADRTVRFSSLPQAP